jgi:hypothetical protein
MLNDYQSLDTLIDGVKGTTNMLSRLISRKTGALFLIVVLGGVLLKVLVG